MSRTWLSRVQNLRPIEWIVVGAVVIGAFLRLWNFSNTLQFLGDQGRDAIVVAQIFKEKDIVLIGPVTSTGNMYLGPLYYYFMLPFLMLTYPNPIGPAYAIAVLSIVTTALMYVLGKQLVGERAAAIATIMFAVSSVVLNFARFSWNPNPAPLLGLLLLWFLYKTETGKFKYWIGIGACVAVLIQLHYVALLTGLVAAVIWIRQLLRLRKEKQNRKDFVVGTVGAVVIFALSLLPLVLFDYRHEWLNVRSLQKFLETSQEATEGLPFAERMKQVLFETHGRSLQLFFEVTIGKHRTLNTALLVGVFTALIYLVKRKKNQFRTGHFILLVTSIVSICGLAFYRSSVFDHYIAFFFPATFLILAAVLDLIAQWRYGWGIAAIALVLYAGYNLEHAPLRTLGWTVHDMKRTAETISQRVQPGEKYNIVLLSETKDVYGMNYRYFLTTTDRPPLKMEHFGEVETLFIIDEQKIEKDVTSLPIYEIVVFPNHTPSEVYQVEGGPEVTVLRKAQ